MNGNQLAKQIKTIKGKVYAFVSIANDGIYLPVEKSALIELLTGCGDSETGMRVSMNLGVAYFEPEQD